MPDKAVKFYNLSLDERRAWVAEQAGISLEDVLAHGISPLPSGPAVVMPQGEEMAMDDTEFVDDSELVDEAGGMDPTPMDESEGGGSETPPPPPIYPAPPAFAGDQVQ